MKVASRPLISLVVPCYKVGRYLPDFLKSIEHQRIVADTFELVFVIDGCPEDSEQIVRTWASGVSFDVRVLVTENQGVSEARNAGIALARGRWISFPDPDDLLGGAYLQQVVASLGEHPDIDLLATRLVRVTEGLTKSLGHVLDYRYFEGSRLLDLATEPQFLQLAVHTAFFRRDVVLNHGVRFDGRLRVFEDGKFVANYLEAAGRTRLFVNCEAHYFYQVRADGSGALATSSDDLVSRYLGTARAAYTELLAIDQDGEKATHWRQYMVLYDLYWLFAAASRIKDPIHGAPRALLDELNLLLREVLRLFSVEVLLSFNLVKVRPEIRAAWVAASSGHIPHRWVRRYRFDHRLQQVELRYLGAAVNDTDKVLVDGNWVIPSTSKWRSVQFFGETWAVERIVWVDAGEEIRLIGTGIEGFYDEGAPESDREFSHAFGWNQPERPKPLDIGNSRPRRKVLARVRSRFRRFRHRVARKFAVVPPFANIYRDLWVLMDRDTQANDNAEALYRYLADERPEINARFVIRKESADFARLKSEGFKVLPFGGVRHFLAVRNAANIVSSHIDEYVVRPFRKLGVGKTWNYVFLQHGVTHNDLSRWLNTKDVQLLVTATEPEAEAFTCDGSPYIFTTKETRLTGFPRHDALKRAMDTVDAANTRRSILIMPTWRSYLLDERTMTGNARTADDAFAESEYVKQWTRMLQDRRLHELAGAHNLELVLLPHPNLEPHLHYFDLPAGITIASYQNGSIAPLLASADITMTDYSSQAFEGAFCLSPCVYFQFDRDEFYGGLHIGSPGYFDVVTDGFGPVVSTVDQSIDSLVKLLDTNSGESQIYSARVHDLYPQRDGKASERVANAIEELGGRRQDGVGSLRVKA